MRQKRKTPTKKNTPNMRSPCSFPHHVCSGSVIIPPIAIYGVQEAVEAEVEGVEGIITG